MGLTEQQIQNIQQVIDELESKTIRINEMLQFAKGILTHHAPFDQETLLNMIATLKADSLATAQEIVELLE